MSDAHAATHSLGGGAEQLPDAADLDEDIAPQGTPSPPRITNGDHLALPSDAPALIQTSNGDELQEQAHDDRSLATTVESSPERDAKRRKMDDDVAPLQGAALKTAVLDLVDTSTGRIRVSAVPTFVGIMASAVVAEDKAFITSALEGSVAKSEPNAPLLKGLVAADALSALETYVAAAADAQEPAMLCRLLKLAAALPVTMAAVQACGLAKRMKRLEKFSSKVGPGTSAEAAAKVDQAASKAKELWMKQLNAETAAAEKKNAVEKAAPGSARVGSTAVVAPSSKPVRVLAVDTSSDMFANTTTKSKAPPSNGTKGRVFTGAQPAPRVTPVSDATAKALLSSRAGAAVPGSTVSRGGVGSAVGGAGSQPAVLSHIAAEQAARLHAAQQAKEHNESRHQAAVAEALRLADEAIRDAWGGEVPPPPTVLGVAAGVTDDQVAPLKSCLSRKTASHAAAVTQGQGSPGCNDAHPSSDEIAHPAQVPVVATPTQPQAPVALRDRKRKRKTVVWAPEAALTQVREFTSEVPAAGETLAFPDPTMNGPAFDGDLLIDGDLVARWLNRAKQETAAERRNADAWRHRQQLGMMHDMMAAPAPPPVPLMTAIHAWVGPPPWVALPAASTGGPPGRGEDSTEVGIQGMRQAGRPPAIYASLAAIPEHPAQGPARSERPEDNANTRWIAFDSGAAQAGTAAVVPAQPQFVQPPQQQLPQAPQYQQQGGMMFVPPGNQPLMNSMPMALPSFSAPQQQQQQQPLPMQLPPVSLPMQPMSTPQSVPQQSATSWPAQQPAWQMQQTQPVQMHVPQPAAPSSWMPPLPVVNSTAALAPVQPHILQPLKAAVPPQSHAPPAAGGGGGDQLSALVRSLTQSGNASVLQQALEGVLQQQQQQQAAQGQAQLAFSAASFTTGGGIPPPKPPAGLPPAPGASMVGQQPPHPGNGVKCHFYDRAGGCRHGSACRFMHA